MNWAHALLMAELLLKAADKIDTIRPPAATKEDAAMTGDTVTETPQTIENEPAAVSSDGVQAAAPEQTTTDQTAAVAQSVDPAPVTASATTQSIIANAVEQPTTSAETVAPTAQDGTAETAGALLQGISELLMLAKILNSNPELFSFLKTLMSGAKPAETKSTQA